MLDQVDYAVKSLKNLARVSLVLAMCQPQAGLVLQFSQPGPRAAQPCAAPASAAGQAVTPPPLPWSGLQEMHEELQAQEPRIDRLQERATAAHDNLDNLTHQARRL